jgi:hypothetical protein
LQSDIAASRVPSAAARALDHKLGGPRSERRYTAPSYEIVRPDTGATAALPGFQPVDAYEAAIANLAPELVRRPRPDSVGELLRWAGEPLATSEVVEIMGRSAQTVRTALARDAVAHAAGADCYWTLAS